MRRAAPRAPANAPTPLVVGNWPVRWKVVAIALVPLLLAAVFGGLRIYAADHEAADLRLAADRAELVPAVNDYMAALENALVTDAAGGDIRRRRCPSSTPARTELQQRLDSANVASPTCGWP